MRSRLIWVCAKTLAESIGAKCILTLYETPNYIAKYRSGADAEEAYWEDYKRALDSADLILCISRIVKEHLTTWIEHLKGARKAYVLNPPIDSITADSILQDANAPVDDLKQRENRIVLISRNVRYKAIKQTVEALIRLLPENALPVKIDVLGDACTKLIMPEREGVTVTLYENMGESDKWRLLSSARALIHPSEFEGFGIPVLEAQKCGCPIIAQRASSIDELIQDKNLLFPTLNFESIDVVRSYIAHNKEKIVYEGIENAKHYTWDKTYEQHKDLYCTLYHKKFD